MKKCNIAIGRFQPFTKGHLNMVVEGNLPCIIYRISSSKTDEDFKKIKVNGKRVTKDNIRNVINYLDNPKSLKLNDTEKEILKRPFTNELIEQEFNIVSRANHRYIEEIIYVKTAYEAIADFAAKVKAGMYEPYYLMCGDDRIDTYNRLINYENYKLTSGDIIENPFKGMLKINIGSGRTEGVSGTAVRQAIINSDKAAFSRLMPVGVDSMFTTFVQAFQSFKMTLMKSLNERKEIVSLYDYITEDVLNNTYKDVVNEGGAAGHMSHPFEYDEMTGHDLIELVDDLFGGKIENMKEKLDGTNIHATMNRNGQVVFIRNKSNLNSELGGMSIQDMADKWADKPGVQKTFMTAGKIITEIFNKLGVKYFNPDNETRKVINCECIIAGKTNIMPYAEDRVAFHGYKIYKLNGNVWEESENIEGHVDDIYKAAEGIDSAKPRMNLVIKSVEEAARFVKVFKSDLENLFKAEGLSLKNTIEDWKRARFNKLKPEWLDKEVDKVYDRWFNGDKSFKAAELKKLYPDYYDYVKSDKFAKQFVKSVMEPIDDLFLKIGNQFIKLCDGFTNSNSHNTIIDTLKKDLGDVCAAVEKSGSNEVKQQLEFQLNRLRKLGDDAINSAEGVVFAHKGKLMKLTGSFSAVNQILGLRFNLNEGVNESVLSDMDDTLKKADAAAKKIAIKNIVADITSTDATKQKDAVDDIVRLLDSHNVPKCKLNDFKLNPYNWLIQIKKNASAPNWREFILLRKMGGYFYIIYIDQFGDNPKYEKLISYKDVVRWYISPRDSELYIIPDVNIECIELNKMCKEILRIMYQR